MTSNKITECTDEKQLCEWSPRVGETVEMTFEVEELNNWFIAEWLGERDGKPIYRDLEDEPPSIVLADTIKYFMRPHTPKPSNSSTEWRRMMEIKTDNSKVIDQLQKQNAEQAARIERLEKAVLIAIHALPGGESKSDVRDIYDETPAQSLAARDAEVVHAFLNKHGTRTGDIIEIDIIDLPHGKYGKQQTNGE